MKNFKTFFSIFIFLFFYITNAFSIVEGTYATSLKYDNKFGKFFISGNYPEKFFNTYAIFKYVALGSFSTGKIFSRMKNPTLYIPDSFSSENVSTTGYTLYLPTVSSINKDLNLFCHIKDFSFLWTYPDNFSITGGFPIKIKTKQIGSFMCSLNIHQLKFKNSDSWWFEQSWFDNCTRVLSVNELYLKGKSSQFFSSIGLSINPEKKINYYLQSQYSFLIKKSHKIFSGKTAFSFCPENYFTINNSLCKEKFSTYTNLQTKFKVGHAKKYELHFGGILATTLNKGLWTNRIKFGIELSQPIFKITNKFQLKEVNQRYNFSNTLSVVLYNSWESNFLHYYTFATTIENDCNKFKLKGNWFFNAKKINASILCEATWKKNLSLEVCAKSSFANINISANCFFPSTKFSMSFSYKIKNFNHEVLAKLSPGKEK
ncbi:MAG: hypothetical protein GX220_08340 [Treponema sp.]|nr:hypothetical protein [Treponema sp.]